jgi:uncharacterized protein (TIGR02300 family)
VAKPEWGTKRICQECGTKFYDMRRAEIICPKCETVFEVVVPKPRRSAPAKPPESAKVAAVAKAKDIELADDDDALDDIDDVEDDDDDEDEDMIEDTTDLGDDDDDMAEVIQKPGAADES